MKYLYLIVFLIFFNPLFSSAQGNYKSGYIVTLKGDTLQGYIDYREWGRNPVKINFKSDLRNNHSELLTPDNIKSFMITGLEYFEAHLVHISQGQVLMANIKPGIDTTYKINTVFLRVINMGKLKFFSYTDDIKTRYYILDVGDEQPIELSYRVYNDPNDFELVQTQSRYRVQLLYFAKKYHIDNNKLDDMIATAKYSEFDISKIIRIINGDTNETSLPKSHFGTRFYVGLGAICSNLSFSGAFSFPVKSSIDPSLSAGFDFIINKNTQKLFIRVDLSYTSDQHAYATAPDATGSSLRLSNIVQHNFSISPQIIYNFYNASSFKSFFGVGVSANISGYNNYNFYQTLSNTASTVVSNYPMLTRFWLSVPVKAGINIKNRTEIYLGYTIPTLITNNNDYSGNVTIYQLGINYLFGER